MNRRTFLASVVVSAPTVLTGCLTASETPELEVSDVTSEVMGDGQLTVTVRVENHGDAVGNPTVQAKVVRPDGTTERKATDANVPPSSNSTPRFEFTDVGKGGFSDGEYRAYGRIESESWIRATDD